METSQEIYLPPISLIGPGALNKLKNDLQSSNYKRVFLITNLMLVETGTAEIVEEILIESGIDYIVYDAVKQYPTVQTVNIGYIAYQQNSCDCIITLGSGSPQDSGKAIGILVSNGGNIEDYEGIDVSKKKSAPLIAINTTTGTANKIAINYEIIDEKRKVKMAMVDKNCLVDIAVNDPLLMVNNPIELSAVIGIDV